MDGVPNDILCGFGDEVEAVPLRVYVVNPGRLPVPDYIDGQPDVLISDEADVVLCAEHAPAREAYWRDLGIFFDHVADAAPGANECIECGGGEFLPCGCVGLPDETGIPCAAHHPDREPINVRRIFPQGGGFSRQMNLAARLGLSWEDNGWTTSVDAHVEQMRRAGARVEEEA